MNKKITVSIALAITIIAMAVTFSVTWLLSMRIFNNTVSAVTQLQAQYGKLAEMDQYVRGNFYGVIDDNILFDRVAVGYVNGLGDRYGVYYTAAEYTDLVDIESGALADIGLEVLLDAEGGYRIVRVHAASPAARAGVENSGRIVSLNGEPARNYPSLAQLKRALMGEQGTDLQLTCLYNVSDEVTYDIRRANYKTPTVEEYVLGDYAYIRIHAFNSGTYADFDYALRQVRNAGVKGLVFDVRGNAGGLFRDAYDMIDLLAPTGTVAKRANKAGTVSVVATSDENNVALPMVVLVNENTSAAAELFAVSVRNMCGGQLVGSVTAGHGTMQSTPQRLSDGSAISVTTAMLLTGRDESFDQVGLEPDVEVDSEQVTEMMLLNPAPTLDPEIMRAYEVLRTMVREGGGDPGPAITDLPASSAPGSESAASPQPPAQSSGLPADSSAPDSSALDDGSAENSASSGSGG